MDISTWKINYSVLNIYTSRYVYFKVTTEMIDYTFDTHLTEYTKQIFTNMDTHFTVHE